MEHIHPLRVDVFVFLLPKNRGGQEALRDAVAMGQSMTLYYDRTVQTGGQIRVIVVEE